MDRLGYPAPESDSETMPPPAVTEPKQVVPLCVDLDGTLIQTDLLWESLVRLLKQNPFYLFAALAWWARGRACLKAKIADRVTVDPANLPYNQAVLDYLRAEKQQGRRLLLVTASDTQLAKKVADHVGCFDGVLASDGKTNLRGRTKGTHLASLFGARGFDYAGNSSVDLPVWQQAREAIVVGGGTGLESRARGCTTVGRVFARSSSWFSALVQAVRPHQWVKNLIILVPLVTSHQITKPRLALDGIVAFVAFSLCASGVYIMNDLFDLDADRQHPRKRNRPFASGALALPLGLVLFPALFVLSSVLAWNLSAGFAAALAAYVALTLSYSWHLKKIALLDVFCLAGLYTIRLISGHEASGIEYSGWLLVFSMFIFLSLALVKRFVELRTARQQNQTAIKGRGYGAADLELVATLGASSGFLAVLVLALYVNSPQVIPLYHHPILLLLICPLLLYWISRVWLTAHRGQMHDDPIVFALKDGVSYIVGFLTLVILWLATR